MTGRRVILMLAVAAVGMAIGVGHMALAFQAGDGRQYFVRVVDGKNQNVPNVVVMARAPAGALVSYKTDDNGRATLRGDVTVEGTWLTAEGKDAVAWARVDDTTGGRPGSMRGRPAVLTLVPLNHQVEGTVLDGQGKPIAGAKVGAHRLIHPKNGTLTQEIQDHAPLLGLATTDAAGKFTVKLPERTNAYLDVKDPRHLGRRILARLDAKALDPVRLEPAGWIAGRAIDSASGKPIAGARVAAQLVERRHRPRTDGWGQGETDNAGRFTVGGLEPGVYNLVLVDVPARPHATAAAAAGIRVKIGAEAAADLAVVEGRPLRGVVVDRGNSDQPVAGAQIGCQGPAHPRTGTALMVTETDARGRFAFHVPPGEHYVYLIDDPTGGRMDRRLVTVPEQGELPPVYLLIASTGESAQAQAQAPRGNFVEYQEAPQGNFVEYQAVGVRQGVAAAAKADEKARTVTGRINDPKGQPVVGVRVSVDTGKEPSDSAVTDRDGTFVIEGLPARQLWITLDRPLEQAVKQAVAADKNEVTATYRAQVDEKARRALAAVANEPIPPELRGRLTLIDLTPHGTSFLADGPGDPGDHNNLDRVPRGVHKLGNDYFLIGDRMIHLRGESRQASPEKVVGIKVGGYARTLHFLHGCQQQAEAGTAVARYVIHYADGTKETIPASYQKQLVDWWHYPTQKNDPSDARIAWNGTNPHIEKDNQNVKLRLYAFDWTNPHPDKVIATIDAVSAVSKCDPFLIAVTLERDK
ncbi:MAG: carboxypeptidase regulatory-like domain-containing protein [Isosphaeraceae bacterium]